MTIAPELLQGVHWGSVTSVCSKAKDAYEVACKKVQEAKANEGITTAQLPVSSVRDAVICLQPSGSGSGPELSIEELREAVADLIAAYSDPQLQSDMQKLFRKSRQAHLAGQAASEDSMNAMRQILLPCQIRVAESYGLPGNQQGLQRLQNAVQRRITEGDIELRFLVDEALMLIGIKPLDSLVQEVPAEEFLQIIQGAAGDNSATDVWDFFRSLGSSPFEVECKTEAFKLLRSLERERRPIGGLTFGLLRTWQAFEKLCLPPEQLVHREEPPQVVRLKNPSPEEFFPFVMANRPVIIESALDDVDFPPLVDFQDFDYLRARCGERYVKVKGDSCWDREGRQIFLNDPTIELPISEYLNLIEQAETHRTCISWYLGKVPLREEIPELWQDIQAAATSPLKRYESCFGPNPKGVHTYFGCGINTTCIHADPSENVLIVISGEKVFDLYPPWEADCIHTTIKKFLNSTMPPFIDPNGMPKDIQDNFPNYKYARPQRVHLKAGDILYLPIFWWHAVQGSSRRNMILNWWCSQHPAKEHRYTEREGAQGVLNIIKRLEEVNANQSSSKAYSSMCDGPISNSKCLLNAVSRVACLEKNIISTNDNKLVGQVYSGSKAATNRFRWKVPCR